VCTPQLTNQPRERPCFAGSAAPRNLLACCLRCSLTMMRARLPGPGQQWLLLRYLIVLLRYGEPACCSSSITPCKNGPQLVWISYCRGPMPPGGIRIELQRGGKLAESVELRSVGDRFITPIDRESSSSDRRYLTISPNTLDTITGANDTSTGGPKVEISCLCDQSMPRPEAIPAMDGTSLPSGWCGIHGCTYGSSDFHALVTCNCTNEWSGQQCNRHHLRFRIIPTLQALGFMAAFAFVTWKGFARVQTVNDWVDSGQEIVGLEEGLEANVRSAEYWFYHVALSWEYLQLGAAAFRETVPWTSEHFSWVGYVTLLFKIVMVEYTPNFVIQYFIVMIFLALISVLGVRKYFRQQDEQWKRKCARRGSLCIILGLTPGIMGGLALAVWKVGDENDQSTFIEAMFALLLSLNLLIVGLVVYCLARQPREGGGIRLFDIFVQFLLPEMLIPIVRRLVAPLLGCEHTDDDEYSTCGAAACLWRQPTMRCAASDTLYAVTLVSSCVLLAPAWWGIIHAIITYQADMAEKPRFPVTAKFALFKAQLRVAVAVTTDSLRDYPLVMLCIVMAMMVAELTALSMGGQSATTPYRHLAMRRYRVVGCLSAIWACVCAFVALHINDKTDITSIWLVCTPYIVVALVAFIYSVHKFHIAARTWHDGLVPRRREKWRQRACCCSCCAVVLMLMGSLSTAVAAVQDFDDSSYIVVSFVTLILGVTGLCVSVSFLAFTSFYRARWSNSQHDRQQLVGEQTNAGNGNKHWFARQLL
jgi:hypothetical protein